jgi:hypothetical protein
MRDLKADARAFLTTTKYMLRLGSPIVLQIAGETSIRLINSLMLGKISQKGLTAYGISTQFSYWFIMLEASIATSTCVLIAKKMAHKDLQDLRRIVNVSYVTGAALIFLAFPFFLSLQKEMTNIFLDSDDEAIHEYTKFMIPLSLLSVLGYGMREISAGALRGYEETKSAMIIGLLGTLFGVVMGAIMAFGLNAGPVSVLLGEVAGMIISAIALHVRYRYKSDNYIIHNAATVELINDSDDIINETPALTFNSDQPITSLEPAASTEQSLREPLLETKVSVVSHSVFRSNGRESSPASDPGQQTEYDLIGGNSSLSSEPRHLKTYARR